MLPETDPLGVQAKKVRSEGDLEVQSNIIILLAKSITLFVAKQVREKYTHTYTYLITVCISGLGRASFWLPSSGCVAESRAMA